MSSKKSTTSIPDFVYDEWHGLNTMTKAVDDLPKGFSPDMLNWVLGWDVESKRSDHIELRLGMVRLGDLKSGSSFVTGLGVGTQDNGTQVPFWTDSEGNVWYYNATTVLNTSVFTLATAAKSDWVSIEPLAGISGNFIYISSYNSSLYRIPVCNPASKIDCNKGQTPASSLQGFINFVNSRMNLWQKNGGTHTSINKTDLLVSQVDFATYGAVNSQSAATNIQLPAYPENGAGETVGTGDGLTTVFSHTLANLNGGTCSNVLIVGAVANVATISAATAADPCVITVSDASKLSVGQYILIEGMTGTMGTTYLNDAVLQIIAISGTSITLNADTSGSTYSSGGTVYSVEYFTDDLNGNLNSNLGGTGTIDYATGMASLTFNTAPISGTKTVATYYYFKPLTGIERFITDNSTGAATAYIWPQRDGGGPLWCVQQYGSSNYCFHLYRTWVEYTDPNAATSSTNLPYRNLIGTPFYKSAYPTGDGIIFLDNSVPSHPKFNLITIAPNTMYQTIEPFDVGQDIDFSIYAFDQPIVFRFDVYDVVCCQSVVNGVKRSFNDTMFIRDFRSGYWARLDYPLSQLVQYNGTLIGGLSIAANLYTLFSSYSDDGAPIENHWTSGATDIDFPGLKTTLRFSIEGLIQTSQSFDIYISYDYGPFAKIQTVSGTDSYVSQGNPQLVGSETLGSKSVGSGAVYANPFVYEFNLASPWYRYIQVQFQATSTGYVEIDKWTLKYNQAKSLMNLGVNSS